MIGFKDILEKESIGPKRLHALNNLIEYRAISHLLLTEIPVA
jgi:hypothetical protein